MRAFRSGRLLATLLLATLLATAAAQGGTASEAEAILNARLAAGRAADAVTELDALLAAGRGSPEADTVRLGLGLAEALAGLERFAQRWYRWGAGQGTAGQELPLPLWLPLPPNPDPEAISYDDVRGSLLELLAALERADAALAAIDPERGAPELRFLVGTVRLDLDGDGVAADRETFWRLFVALNPGAAQLERQGALEPEAAAFPLDLDLGDALWLRGYLNLLTAGLEIVLAHDARRPFEVAGRLFFARVEGPDRMLDEARLATPGIGFDAGLIADAVAFLHLLRLEPTEPERLERALERLRRVPDLSRASWAAILAETDDRREWLPNPQQTGALPAGGPGAGRGGVRLERPVIDGWLAVMDELDAVLAGERLIPHWRLPPGRGIDLPHAFLDPTTFDLLLWIQGSAALPHARRGEVSGAERWADVVAALRGNLLGYAVWFN